MQSLKNIAIICLLLSVCVVTRAQVVCSEDELVRELREDLADNGKLDCLRVALSPEEKSESQIQRAKRLSGQWESDCAFEAQSISGESTWMDSLGTNYGIETLVDVNGEPVENDFADQADMCEIVRAIVHAGKIPQVGNDVTKISMDLIDFIDCVGEEGQTEVCAATGSSYANKQSWFVLLDPSNMQISQKPVFEVAPTADEPEVEE